MKTAKVNYKAIDDNQIKIIGFEGVSTFEGIKIKKGFAVANKYCKDYPRFAGDELTVQVFTAERSKTYDAGSILPKVEFQEMVSNMKQAGKRLLNIEKEVAVKTIEI